MAEITLITGGCRSGKSNFARKLGESLQGPRAFLATCPVLDEEMNLRIEKHRGERSQGGWETLEETLHLDSALAVPGAFRVFLLECLSLWVNNLMYQASQKGSQLGEAEIESRCREILATSSRHSYSLLIVTNEVGMGIVPDNALARQYRDLLGRANQVMAEAARKVVLMVSGIPLVIKE